MTLRERIAAQFRAEHRQAIASLDRDQASAVGRVLGARCMASFTDAAFEARLEAMFAARADEVLALTPGAAALLGAEA